MNQEKIGKFIRSIRNEKNMTQQELADIIGVTDRAISKWENGRGMPDIMFLIPLSEVLGVTVLELLNGEKKLDENKALVGLLKQKENKIKLWKDLSLIIINIIMIYIIISLIFGFIIPNIYNNNNKGITKIISESMMPTLKINDYIIYNKKNISDVKKNDIVIYYYTDSNNNILSDYVIVHRVIDIIKEKDNIKLITKGDNNEKQDINYVDSNNYIGIYQNKINILSNTYLNNNNLSSMRLIFLLFTIIIIVILDIIQIKYYLNNKH